MSRSEFIDWQRRQAALVSHGWVLLRFANTDVRDWPQRCREHISLTLRRARESHAHRQRLTDAIVILQKELSVARAGDEHRLRLLTDQIDQLRVQLKRAERTQPLSSAESEHLAQLDAAQEHITVLKEENSTMKTTIWAFTTLLAVVIVSLVMYASRGTGDRADLKSAGPADDHTVGTANDSLSSTPSWSEVALGASCDKPVPWQDAKNFAGRWVAVSGPVAEIVQSKDTEGAPIWINVGKRFPDPGRLTLVIWADHRPVFQNVISQTHARRFCVLGKVDIYKGVAQIQLRTSDQLVIMRNQ